MAVVAEGYLDRWQAPNAPQAAGSSRFYALEPGVCGVGESSRPRSATNRGLSVLGGSLTGMIQLCLQFRLGLGGSRQWIYHCDRRAGRTGTGGQASSWSSGALRREWSGVVMGEGARDERYAV
jgi:hypothetical protein